ncbi:universal stress protein [Arthrobacter sp. NPDC093128]|uniref:universal stress protein n=1 Tax=Arthrobacter sp. NPDC093128 TaxID=3154979 RepID=UPI0034469911
MAEVIVVGVDHSPSALRTAQSASRIAAALDSTLNVVTAFDNDRITEFGSGSDRLMVSDADEAEQVAKSVVGSLGTAGVDAVPFAVRGTPAQALIRHAEMYEAHTIVVGNKHMQGLGRVLGSVANSVAHGAQCDVLIVKTNNA